MDAPNNKGSSLKPSPLPKPTNSGVGESNENELNNNSQRVAKTHNPKKPAKHFMSPTFSAASKAAVPRKKILGERNEALPTLSDTHSQKSRNLESRITPLKSRISQSGRSSPRVMSSYSYASESDDDENNAFVVDSSLKPYDPLTNYLSPRPKYLRYKPDRRHEIISLLESDIGEEKDGTDVERIGSVELEKVVSEEESSDDAQDSSLPPVEEGLVKISNDDEVVQEDEEKVVSEEESSADAQESSLPPMEEGLVKSNNDDAQEDGEKVVSEEESSADVQDSSLPPMEEGLMKSNNDDEVVQEDEEEEEEIEEEGGWSLKGFLKFLLVIFVLFLSTSYISSMNMPTPSYTQQAINHLTNEYHRIHEHLLADVSVKMFGDGNGSQDQVRASDSGVFEVDQRRKEVEEHVETVVAIEEVEDDKEEVMETDYEQAEMVEPIDVLAHQVDGTEEVPNREDLCDGEVEIKQDGSEHDEDAVAYEMEKATETSELFDESQKHSDSELFDDHDTIINSSTDLSDIRSDVEAVEEIFEKTVEFGGFVEEEVARGEDSISKSDDELIVSRTENSPIESDTTNLEDDVGSTEVKNIEIESTEVKNMAFESVPAAILVILFSSMLVALVYNYLSRKTGAVREHSQPRQINPVEKATVTETLPARAFPTMEQKHTERKAESFRHAPNAELLGELVFGEVSSSLRSCDRKSKMKMVESEESNGFSFHERTFHRQPAEESSSTTDSPSYGSFTTERKILKKEKGKDAVITTPVRRSSRLLNRSAMSP